jgi:hypothetical protein
MEHYLTLFSRFRVDNAPVCVTLRAKFGCFFALFSRDCPRPQRFPPFGLIRPITCDARGDPLAQEGSFDVGRESKVN